MHVANFLTALSLSKEDRLLTLFLAVLGLLIGGCGTEATTAGQKSYLYTTAAGKEVLTTLPCGNTTEARIMARAMIGIPYGRRPQDFNVPFGPGQPH